MRHGQTRIPEIPDQTEFLNRWYEFHQGYRVVIAEDGSEERIAVLGEDFKDVNPGILPRTLEELRNGVPASEAAMNATNQVIQVQTNSNTDLSLEETLDAMFQAASMEENGQQPGEDTEHATDSTANQIQHGLHFNSSQRVTNRLGGQDIRSNVHAQAMTAARSRNPNYQTRRVAALRRELRRMRNGIERVISGLRDLGENVPDHREATGHLADLGRTLDAIDGAPSREEAEEAMNSFNILTSDTATSHVDREVVTIQTRIDEARNHLDDARRVRDQAASELELAEQELRSSQQRLQQLQREQRTAENYIRIFGSREEMLAQGDQYESPISGMFSRAMERFRAAEEIRRQEITLRRVLEDEARSGGAYAPARLLAFHNQQPDIWGVPQQSDRQMAPYNRSDEVDGDLPIEPRGELEEYYEMIRRQDRNQQSGQQEGLDRAVAQDMRTTYDQTLQMSRDDNFPQNMLNDIITAREREMVDRENTSSEDSIIEQTDSRELERSVASARGQENERHADIAHMLQYLLLHQELMTETSLGSEGITNILTRLNNSSLTANDERDVSQFLECPRLVWSSRLIAVRFLRRRQEGIRVQFLPDVPQDDFQRNAENLECMAEAFQMSAELRRHAPDLTAPEQLSMLYRLQAGERRMDDVEKLRQMLSNNETFDLAVRVHSQTTNANSVHQGHSQSAQLMEESRRAAARRGDHSRRELDAQRRAARAFAIAAGRTAMRTGASGLLEQMAQRDEETQAAYERLQRNGFVSESNGQAERLLGQTFYRPLNAFSFTSASESDSDDEDAAGYGLDAKDSDRPEPKTDEELQISMDCRICYTQLADIVCLPCGHLVMCKWCSDQHSPTMAHDRTRPRRAAGCPVCRKGIRQKIKVIRA